jgi:peptidoglycan/xylan/chitin deacetylase (PgdA/CDA1 family)
MLAAEKAVYLTIDDGPAEDFVQKVNFLNAKGIRAIWFCMGEALERFSKEAIDAIKAGHIIGNRSYDHADFSAISLHDAREQIERTDCIIDELYTKAETIRPSKLFRFPFMQHLQDKAFDDHFEGIQRVLDQLGYHQPSIENMQYSERISGSLKSGLHVECTWDTFDLERADVVNERDDLQASNGNEIIMIHDWISVAPFKALMDKLIAKNVVFQLPKEMSLQNAAL